LRHRALLSALVADENLIETRKLNVRRFGAHWLRPPGVAKTFQARMDEEEERKEQLEMQRREAQMAELQAAANAEMGVGPGGGGEDGADEMEEEMEGDLDADVPDADEMADDEEDDDDDDDDDEDGEDDDGGEGHGEMSQFHEDSLLEGSIVGGDGMDARQTQSFLDAEDAELDGRAQDMRDLGLERDLDDDVLEAGSYEHTDTEQEDESDEDDEEDSEQTEDMMNSSFSLPGPRRRSRHQRGSRVHEIDFAQDYVHVPSQSNAGASPADLENPFLTRRPGRG
jgi:Apc15p protein